VTPSISAVNPSMSWANVIILLLIQSQNKFNAALHEFSVMRYGVVLIIVSYKVLTYV